MKKLKATKVAVLALAGAVFVHSGISLTHTPEYETVYSLDILVPTCGDYGCVGSYHFKIGNTGKTTQNKIEVQLNKEIQELFILPITVLNFGKVRREFDLVDSGQNIQVSFGPLEPGKWVDLTFVLRYRSLDKQPSWAMIFQSLHPTNGSVKRGFPDGVRFGRFLYGFVDLFS